MARNEEITGGSAVYPMSAGTFTKNKRAILGFIPNEDCSVTDIEFTDGNDWNTYYGLDYSSCVANRYYHFKTTVSKATFSTAVDLIFE